MENRIPPHDLEAERALIGACFVNSSIINKVKDVISYEDFYRDAHSHIFDAMCEIGEGAEVVTIAQRLTQKNLLEKTGGKEYLGQLVDVVFTSAGWRNYADIIRGMAERRRIIFECARVSQECFELHKDIPGILKDHEGNLQYIEQGSQVRFRTGVHISNVYTSERMIEEYRAYIEDLKKNRFITGLDAIDAQIRGVSGGEVLYIIARAGSFKTAILQNMLKNYVNHSAWGAAFFSLEMPVSSLTERYHEIVNLKSGQEIEEIYLAESGTEKARLEQNLNVSLKNLFIIPTQVNIQEIKSYTHLIEKQFKIKIGLIGIDYLGLIDGEGKGEYEIVSKICKSIKQMAKLLGLPFVVLSQTSRKAGSGEIEISMDMGRGSGVIEESGDFVLGAFQDNSDVVLKILKNRKGHKGSCWKLNLNPETLNLKGDCEHWNPNSPPKLPPKRKMEI